MSKIVINNVELELDLLDADAMETYQNSLSATIEALEKAKGGASVNGQNLDALKQVAATMRLQCQLTETFIDQIFGEGTAKKCFPRPNHLGDHLEAFTLVCNQANQAVQQAKEITNKYSGERLNREQRRQQNKNQGKNRNNHNAAYPVR